VKVDVSKIFVKVCSLDDEELVPTLYDAIIKADKPENLHFGVYLHYKDKQSLQVLMDNLKELKKEGSKFTILTAEFSQYLLGVGKSRATVDNMYDNEEYVLQIDSHSWFPFSWDSRLIDLIKHHNTKTILSGYCAPYGYDEHGVRSPIDMGKLLYKQHTDKPVFNTWLFPQWNLVYPEDDQYFIDIDFCANFSFGTYEWGRYSGIYEKAIFFSEEPIQTMNLKSKGFNILYPNIDEPMICHLYKNDIKDRGRRKDFTDYLTPHDSDYLLNIMDRHYYEDYLQSRNK
jgi:hypothetical protein